MLGGFEDTHHGVGRWFLPLLATERDEKGKKKGRTVAVSAYTVGSYGKTG